MSEQIKRLYNVGIGKETTRGAKITPTFWIKALTNNIQDRIELVKSDRQVGVIEGKEDAVISKKFSQGSITGEVFDKSFGLFLLGALGSVSSAVSGDAGVYNHTFTVLQSAQHPSFTIVEKRGDIEEVAYANSVIESLDLSFALNDYVKFTANIKGKAKVADTSTPAYVSENYFMAKNVSVKIADTYSGLSAGSSICCKALDLSIAKNVVDDECLGNDGPSDFLNQQFELTGSLELYFSSIYERDYALNNTIKAMRIEIEDTNTTIGSTSHPKLVIDLAKVKFEEPVISDANNDIVRLVLNFEGYYSASDELLVQAVLTNTQTSY